MRKLTVLAVMIFGFVSAASAAPKIDISAGYSYARMISAGNYNEEEFKQDSFVGYGVAADMYTRPELSFGIEAADLAGFSDKLDNTDYSDENQTRLKISEIGLRAKYNYTITEKISMYGLLGIGKYCYKAYYERFGLNYNNIGFNIGLGVKMSIADNIFAGIDLRYHFLPEWEVKENDNEYKPIKSGAGLFVPTFFMGYSF